MTVLYYTLEQSAEWEATQERIAKLGLNLVPGAKHPPVTATPRWSIRNFEVGLFALCLLLLGCDAFYDYDEIEYLTDCNFRRIPPAPSEEYEMSGEVWYSVGRHDVFPEEFGTFLLGSPTIRKAFMRHHADLLDATFWQGCKERILAGHVHDVFPYDESKRFSKAA